MIFASPAWLAALLALPLLAALEAWLGRRDRDRLARLVSRPLWGRVVRRPKERWRWLRLGFLLLGGAGLVVALARPQWGIVREKVEREGVDVVLVLDTSGSMNTPDVAPSRFFLARQALLQLIGRLEGDRFALVAFADEAYPLVPLTLDADALGLFLETVEPGIVPAPGTSLGVGLAKGLDAFVDKERRNKVMVLVSDGEDLEGEVEQAVRKAREAGVVVHAVGVGTEGGQPVPEVDADGRTVGYKRDESGQPVVSRLNMAALEEIARGTGGKAFRITPADTSLSGLASAIEGMEQKTLAREYSYRRKERFQVPLAFGLAALAVGLLLPPPPLRRRRATPVADAGRVAALLLLAMAVAAPAWAQAPAAPPTTPAPPAATPATGGPGTPGEQAARRGGSVVDELLLRPRRATEEGRAEYARGSHPQALSAFERAAAARPQDPATRFNVADGLYKNGKYDEAATLYRALGSDPASPLAGAARYNLGNSLYQKHDYRDAARAYRDALQLAPRDADTRRNLEMALRALEEQQEQQKREQDQKDQKPQDQKQQQQKSSQDQKQQQQDQQKQPQQQQRPPTPQEREDQRFREATGMPKERAMQLLDALQQNERAEQKKLLAAKRAQARKKGKDW